MALGTNYSTDANGDFYITHPADRFSSRSEFAYVMTLDQGIGKTQVKLVFARVEAGGAESVVFSQTFDISDPTFNEEANKFPIIDVLGGEPAGKYKVEIETDTAVLASAVFTYTG